MDDTPNQPKADLTKRCVAALIDFLLAAAVSLIPLFGGILGALYILCRDGLELDFMNRRSIGKTLLKVRAVRDDGEPVDLVTSMKRNLPFALAPIVSIVPILGWLLAPVVATVIGVIELVLVLVDDRGQRLGDRLADTIVIDSQD